MRLHGRPGWVCTDPAWLQQLGEAVAQSWAWPTTVLPVWATLAGWLVPLVWTLGAWSAWACWPWPSACIG